MKKIILLFIFATTILSFSYGQISYRMTHSLTFIGQDDHKGYNLQNGFSIPIYKMFYIDPSLGITISSNSKVGSEIDWHNSSYINFELPLVLRLKANKFGFFGKIGGSVRNRNETIPYRLVMIGNNYEQIYYKNNTTLDIGYTVGIGMEYYTKHKLNYGLNISLEQYNKGTQLFTLGLSLIYEF